MLKAQFPSVQHLSREGLGVFLAINFVAKNGMAKMPKMNSNLVCPAAVQFAFNETHLVRRAQDTVIRFRFASAPRRSRHPLSIDWMASDLLFNRSSIFAHPSSNKSQINLFNRALLELLG